MSLETFLEEQTGPRRITDWLEKNYPNKRTRASFYDHLRLWIKCFYGKDYLPDYKGGNLSQDQRIVKRNVKKRINEIEAGIERYFNELDGRDFKDDIKTFLNWVRNEGYAGLTIRRMSASVKTFFSEQDTRSKISKEGWKEIKRTLIPKSTRAATQDDILTKEQLKMVLQHLSIHSKALALFLLSTGARIGAVLQLQIGDIKLDSDPPEVTIRNEYTKGEVGGRVMWFSEEARDAIIEWHKIRPFKKKGGGFGSYDENLVFNGNRIFASAWNTALRRADGGRVPAVLAKRDPSTKKRIHVYHVHTLRKFFRTNMGLAGVPDFVVHGWMGHKKYLAESYDKLGKRRMAKLYKDHMDVVTVYEVGISEKIRAEVKEAIELSEKLAKQVTVDGVYLDMVGEQLGAFAGLSEEEIEALSGKEKWTFIINKASQLKEDAASAREQSHEEIEKALKFIPITK